MAKQLNDAYIVSAVRTPVGRAPRGMFKNVRPDALLTHCFKGLLEKNPQLDPHDIDDAIAKKPYVHQLVGQNGLGLSGRHPEQQHDIKGLGFDIAAVIWDWNVFGEPQRRVHGIVHQARQLVPPEQQYGHLFTVDRNVDGF